MNSETFNQVNIDAAASLSERVEKLSFQQRAEAARQAVQAEMDKLVSSNDAYLLSDEEQRMLLAFRRFKQTCKAGSVFKWQTRPAEGLILAEERSLIVGPQEVAADA